MTPMIVIGSSLFFFFGGRGGSGLGLGDWGVGEPKFPYHNAAVLSLNDERLGYRV